MTEGDTNPTKISVHIPLFVSIRVSYVCVVVQYLFNPVWPCIDPFKRLGSVSYHTLSCTVVMVAQILLVTSILVFPCVNTL